MNCATHPSHTDHISEQIPHYAYPERAYMPLYHQGSTNHCPACSGNHWIIGRSSAQCAYCHTALPLAPAQASYHYRIEEDAPKAKAGFWHNLLFT